MVDSQPQALGACSQPQRNFRANVEEVSKSSEQLAWWTYSPKRYVLCSPSVTLRARFQELRTTGTVGLEPQALRIYVHDANSKMQPTGNKQDRPAHASSWERWNGFGVVLV
jgi:hypothetical protein